MNITGRKDNAIADRIIHYDKNLHDPFPFRRHFSLFIGSFLKLKQAAPGGNFGFTGQVPVQERENIKRNMVTSLSGPQGLYNIVYMKRSPLRFFFGRGSSRKL